MPGPASRRVSPSRRVLGAAGPEDGDSGIEAGLKDKWISKIQVEGYKAAVFQPAALDDRVILKACERLLSDGTGIVTGGDENGFPARAEVLVQLEFHAAGSNGTLT